MKKTALITGACINTGVAIVEKFASEGYDVIFTGRNIEKVRDKEAEYRAAFPQVQIRGYAIDSLLDERTVDEQSVAALFEELDSLNQNENSERCHQWCNNVGEISLQGGGIFAISKNLINGIQE